MRRIVIVIFSILGLISIDFFSKKYIESILSIDNNKYFSIFGDYIGISLSYNTGIAFSLPITGIPLQIVTIFLVVWLIWYYVSEEYSKHSKLLDIWYVFILAWAISHAYERIFVWHVIDFIAVKYFAILNFADILISIGACFIFFVYYVRKK